MKYKALFLVFIFLFSVVEVAFAGKKEGYVGYGGFLLKEEELKDNNITFTCSFCKKIPENIDKLYKCSSGQECVCKPCLDKQGERMTVQDDLLIGVCKTCATAGVNFTPVLKTIEKDKLKGFYIYCGYDRCTWYMPLKSHDHQKMEEHSKFCIYNPHVERCDLCNNLYPKETKESHLLEDCEMRSVECEGCHTFVCYKDLNGLHRNICEAKKAIKLFDGVVDLGDSEKIVSMLKRAMSQLVLSHEELEGRVQSLERFQGKIDEKMNGYVDMLVNDNIINGRMVDIFTDNLEQQLQDYNCFAGISTPFSFDDESQGGLRLAMVVHNEDGCINERASCNVELWLLDEKNTLKKTGNISPFLDDLDITVVFPAVKLGKSLRLPKKKWHGEVAEPFPYTGKFLGVQSYALSTLVSDLECLKHFVWQQSTRQGRKKVRMAVDSHSSRRQQERVWQQIVKNEEAAAQNMLPFSIVENNRLRLILPLRLFKAPLLDIDKEIYGWGKGFFIKLGSELWNIYIGNINNESAIGFILASENYEMQLKQVDISFLMAGRVINWKKSLEILSQKERAVKEYFDKQVRDGGYGVIFPMEEYNKAGGGDYVIMLLKINDGYDSVNVSIVDGYGDKQEERTLFEREKMLSRKLSEEKVKVEALVETVHKLEYQFKTSQFTTSQVEVGKLLLEHKYSSGSTEGSIEERGGYYVWKVSDLIYYSQRYNIKSPTFDISGVTYQLQLIPVMQEKRLILKLKALSSVDGNLTSMNMPVSRYRLSYFDAGIKQDTIFSREFVKSTYSFFGSKNPNWDSMRGSGLVIANCSDSFFSREKGFEFGIMLW